MKINKFGYNKNKLYDILKNIFLLPVIISKKEKIKKPNTIILGAFGCGVFGNDPKLIASLFMDICKKYGGHYENIVFAIPPDINYKIFKQIFNKNGFL